MADIKIQIKNLYKIFGNKPDQVMQLVRDGMSKQELLDQHRHVPACRISILMSPPSASM